MSKENTSRVSAVATALPGVPLCLSSGDFSVVSVREDVLFIGDHQPPKVISESSFQAAHRFVACPAFSDRRVEVGAAGAVQHPDLRDRGKIDRRVQLAVAGSPGPRHGVSA